ncbi:hypothetical protein [Oscillatoria sp. HE19RPO]|uniref:hypothetical protein n=1 Tax=Oscillatoria sp. HE19RPO TaxID=2954806 RepID=UPI0020C3EDDE|nr:hypothetical protein [Oscillatoria sp. HE19RPO]
MIPYPNNINNQVRSNDFSRSPLFVVTTSVVLLMFVVTTSVVLLMFVVTTEVVLFMFIVTTSVVLFMFVVTTSVVLFVHHKLQYLNPNPPEPMKPGIPTRQSLGPL